MGGQLFATRSRVLGAAVLLGALSAPLPAAPMPAAPMPAAPMPAAPMPAAPVPAAPGARPAQGKFLVASRELRDPNFDQTVVLLIEYGREGALGLIVNRPTDVRLAEALPQIDGVDGRPDVLHEGGPVLPAGMMVLLRRDDPVAGSQHVFDDVHASAAVDVLRRALAEGLPPDHLRVFSGHSGWAPGQLDAEIARGSWLVLPGDAELVFAADPSEVWPQLIRHESDLLASLPADGPPARVLRSGGEAEGHRRLGSPWQNSDRHESGPFPPALRCQILEIAPHIPVICCLDLSKNCSLSRRSTLTTGC